MLNNMLQILHDYSTFRHKGILSKKISLDYTAESKQPNLFFHCADNRYSFRTHSLELGDEEAVYWHLAAQRNKEIKFQGFTNKLSFGNKIRGYIEVPEDYHQTGICMEKGRLTLLRPYEEMLKSTFQLVNAVMMVNTQLKKHMIDKELGK